LGAGLLDGLNPCAFATLVFLISYLTAMKRKGTEVLLVGVAFTLGVFVTYLSIGLGAWRLLSAVPDLARWGRWAIGATALLCLFLAVFSFLDFLRARKGDVKEMRLTMPDRLRKRANAAIRRVSTARAFVLLSFPLGVVVSVLELACTGQVYLPVIMAALSMPEHRISAALLLVLYNLMFVLPLIVVFCLVYYGKTAFQLGQALKRHAATVKLGTAVLFLILAGWLALTAASSAGLLQAAG
jgi:cytochrome c biogenesis protein CcdA